jgi:hypothetical protein
MSEEQKLDQFEEAERMRNICVWLQRLPYPPPPNVSRMKLTLYFDDGSSGVVELQIKEWPGHESPPPPLFQRFLQCMRGDRKWKNL